MANLLAGLATLNATEQEVVTNEVVLANEYASNEQKFVIGIANLLEIDNIYAARTKTGTKGDWTSYHLTTAGANRMIEALTA